MWPLDFGGAAVPVRGPTPAGDVAPLDQLARTKLSRLAADRDPIRRLFLETNLAEAAARHHPLHLGPRKAMLEPGSKPVKGFRAQVAKANVPIEAEREILHAKACALQEQAKAAQ